MLGNLPFFIVARARVEDPLPSGTLVFSFDVSLVLLRSRRAQAGANTLFRSRNGCTKDGVDSSGATWKRTN